ncbi:Na-translocating system protein MpsC family protein [Marinococcus halotolerans]|uniref:Na-translocating system protein MpsC family protein n=1 Tax=Marinococcus halotolerans TaxID=301092 RepID=UPI0003B427D5|nr:Na-translocating system protein MpsC family protein [Marinococcus halotolerans]
MEVNKIQYSIAGYVGRKLRDYLGKGPTSTYVSIAPPYVIIQLEGMLAPVEEMLTIDKKEVKVERLRYLFMKKIELEFCRQVNDMADCRVENVYFDWNLGNRTGLIMAVIETDYTQTPTWPKPMVNLELEQCLSEMGKEVENIETVTETAHWLNERTLIVERTFQLSALERELFDRDYSEELKKVRKALGEQGVKKCNIEEAAGRKVEDVFMITTYKKMKNYLILLFSV